MKLLLLAILFLSVILVSSTVLSQVDAKSKDSKAKDKIISAMGKAVEGRYAQIDIVSLSKKNDNGTITFYNTTKSTPIPPPPQPTPEPHPTTNISRVCIVGDLDGNKVPDMMKGCPYKIALGDLGYDDDLKWFKSLNFNKCLQGNHESANEDGSSSIEKETQLYCGDSWKINVGKATLILGFNTNGNLDNQLAAVKQVSFSEIKSVIISSHKPCYTAPNSHHPVESKIKTFCEAVTKVIPAGIKVYYMAAHNHVLAQTSDGTKFLSGAGGRSHYSCGQDQIWTFCNNSKYGYLEVTIDNNNGNIATKFIY